MSTAPAPIAQIAITTNPPGLLVQTARAKRKFGLPGLAPAELADLKARLPDMLQTFRRSVGPTSLTLGRYASRALIDLDRWGRGLAARLLGGTATDEYDVDQFEAAVAELLYPVLQSADPETRIIELESETGREEDAWLLPIEFLRIAAPARLHPQPKDVLLRALGFQAVVVRHNRIPTGPALLGPDTIPVAALIYEGNDLVGPAVQAAFLDRHPTIFAPRRWPRGVHYQQDTLAGARWPTCIETDVAAGLADEVLAAAGLGATHVPQARYHGGIVHVACHYHTREAPGLIQSAPFLSFDRLKTNIGIEALWDAFATLTSASGGRPNVARTAVERFGRMLVFLNACETAASAEHRASLLVKLFRLGFRHVIASETLIPDPLGAAFARQFYIGLMRGLCVGAAVLQARTELLERYENPGGLLYTLYGDPWLRLGIHNEEVRT